MIHANAQMLERWGDRDPTVRTDSLHAIIEESAGLARMVSGMLTLAKAESGDDIPREPVALADVLADALRSSSQRAADKGLTLRLAGDLAPDALVNGNSDLLRQLFTNLIENGIKFTEVGGVDVSASANPATVVVEVADTGVGIEDESLARVFDRFYRTDKSRNRAVEGTGLGLAIVRSIARVHNGSVDARRRRDGGTLFRVVLPRLQQAAAAPSPAPAERAFISRQ